MAPTTPAHIDYRDALYRLGFERDWVVRAQQWQVREVRAGSYVGLRDLVTRLIIMGATPMTREHHRDQVIREVEAEEGSGRGSVLTETAHMSDAEFEGLA